MVTYSSVLIQQKKKKRIEWKDLCGPDASSQTGIPWQYWLSYGTSIATGLAMEEGL